MGALAGRRIALIGGAGFVGHQLALRLQRQGAEPLVIDSLAVNNYFSLKRKAKDNPATRLYLKIIHDRLSTLEERGIPFFLEDARDYEKLTARIKELGADTIVHLAGVSHADRSNKDPYSSFDHSLRTLGNSLDVARNEKLGIKHFIYFSSSMVYGHFNDQVVTEESPCEPLGIYAALKFAGEKIVIAYNQVFDLPYTIIRTSALYGERCISRRVGQVFIENALQGNAISIRGDGSDRLDFTYIDDLGDGIVKVLENKNAQNQIFNMTYGESRSISDLANALAKLMEGIRIEYVPRDHLVPVRGTLSIEKARRELGYDPRHSLESGLVRYVNWYLANWKTWQQENHTEILPAVLTR